MTKGDSEHLSKHFSSLMWLALSKGLRKTEFLSALCISKRLRSLHETCGGAAANFGSTWETV